MYLYRTIFITLKIDNMKFQHSSLKADFLFIPTKSVLSSTGQTVQGLDFAYFKLFHPEEFASYMKQMQIEALVPEVVEVADIPCPDCDSRQFHYNYNPDTDEDDRDECTTCEGHGYLTEEQEAEYEANKIIL